MNAVQAYALSKKYTDETADALGAVKGAPCTIQSIVDNVDGTHNVTFAWKDNNGETHTSVLTVSDGAKGDTGAQGPKGEAGAQGPKGDTGAQGIQGIQGPAGAKGDKGDTGNTGATGANGVAATIQVGTVTSGESPSIQNVGTAQDAKFNFVLPKGDKGDKGEKGADGADGKSFDIKAQFPTEAALRAAHPTGNAGDAYFVGADENPDLYVWLTDENDWFNNGKIAGVKGDKGDTGDDGFSPVAQVTKVGKVTTVTIRDKTGVTTENINDGADGDDGKSAYEVAVDEGFVGTEAEWLASLVGPQGPQGVQGIQGPQGIQGVQGETGIGVPDSGAQGQVLAKKSAVNYDTEWKTIGTAAVKNATDNVRPNSHDLVESGAVYNAIINAVSSIYTPRGDLTCAELTSALLIDENVGNVYEMSDSSLTTELFLQGAGETINAGDNVGIIKAGQNTYLFNLMANAFDLTDYQKKELDTTIESATTVEGALGALSTNKQPKNLTTPITVGGVTQLTVEGTLGAINTDKMPWSANNVLGAKNLLKNEAVDKIITGVTCTVNADKSVTVIASPSSGSWNFRLSKFTLKAGTYILTDGIGGSDVYTQIVNESESTALGTTKNKGLNGHTFTIANDATVIGRVFWETNKTFNTTLYPMLRLAEDSDNTYVPYAPVNKDTLSFKINGALGAKNLLPITATSKVVNDVTFTVYTDGRIKANGTASATAWFEISHGFKLEDRNYILTGCPKNGSGSTYEVQFRSTETDSSQWNMFNDYGDGKIAHGDPSRNYIAFVGIHEGATVDNMIFYPMLRLAEDTDETYTPYAFTNRQLTQAISNRNLLDNPWFTVNQRDLTTYSPAVSGRRFTVDRWSENIYATTKVVSTGITITSDSSNNNADLGQALEDMYKYLVGKTMTASVMMADGTVYSKSGIIEPNTVGTIRFPLTNGFMCDVNTNSANSYIGFFIYSTANNPNKTISVRAVKLELGSTSTLIFDTAPNYADELAKCQRYFERNHWFSWAGIPCVSNGYIQLGCTYPFKVVKRAVPKFTMNPTTAVGIGNGYLLDVTTNTYIDKATVTLVQPDAYNYRMLQVKVQHASLVSGHTYAFAIGDNVIDISADIT